MLAKTESSEQCERIHWLTGDFPVGICRKIPFHLSQNFSVQAEYNSKFESAMHVLVTPFIVTDVAFLIAFSTTKMDNFIA